MRWVSFFLFPSSLVIGYSDRSCQLLVGLLFSDTDMPLILFSSNTSYKFSTAVCSISEIVAITSDSWCQLCNCHYLILGLMAAKLLLQMSQ